jgi:hypothetical protein
VSDEHPAGAANPRPPTDLRRHRRQTERNLILGGFGILFTIGGGVLWYQYGLQAAVAAWTCLGGGLALFGVLWLTLRLAERWVNRRK